MALFLWEKVKVWWLTPPVLIMSPQAASVASFHCTRESAIGSPFVFGAVHNSVAPAPLSISVAVRSVTASAGRASH